MNEKVTSSQGIKVVVPFDWKFADELITLIQKYSISITPFIMIDENHFYLANQYALLRFAFNQEKTIEKGMFHIKKVYKRNYFQSELLLIREKGYDSMISNIQSFIDNIKKTDFIKKIDFLILEPNRSKDTRKKLYWWGKVSYLYATIVKESGVILNVLLFERFIKVFCNIAENFKEPQFSCYVSIPFSPVYFSTPSFSLEGILPPPLT